jgi:hypothetical protein
MARIDDPTDYLALFEGKEKEALKESPQNRRDAEE